jgi:ABC-type phosphate/phosphonate transport system permease subunit
VAVLTDSIASGGHPAQGQIDFFKLLLPALIQLIVMACQSSLLGLFFQFDISLFHGLPIRFEPLKPFEDFLSPLEEHFF